MNEKKVPVLTDAVDLAGPAREPALTLTDDELAELQARIATLGYALMEKLLHESLREMEANLFADVIGRLDDPQDTALPKDQRPWALLRLEKAGDEVMTILSRAQRSKLRRYLKRWPLDALLFSGGGNDIIGPDLLPLLRDFTRAGLVRPDQDHPRRRVLSTDSAARRAVASACRAAASALSARAPRSDRSSAVSSRSPVSRR